MPFTPTVRIRITASGYVHPWTHGTEWDAEDREDGYHILDDDGVSTWRVGKGKAVAVGLTWIAPSGQIAAAVKTAQDSTTGPGIAPPNPKQAFGDKKPALDEFPLSAHIMASLAGQDGDNKYGFRNWRDDPVEARTYIKGALRHLRLFEEGEDYTRDSKVVHNLGAVIMGCAILIDAQLNGTLIDNRVKSKAACDLLHDAEISVAYLRTLQEERDAAKAAKASSPPPPTPLAHAGADTPAGAETT